MNSPKTNPEKGNDQSDQCFSRFPSQIRGIRKQENQEVHKKISVSNKFEDLEDNEEENQEKLMKENSGPLFSKEKLESDPMVEV